MTLLLGYAVLHKKFRDSGSVIESSNTHIKIQWADGRTSVYSRTFAKEILERAMKFLMDFEIGDLLTLSPQWFNYTDESYHQKCKNSLFEVTNIAGDNVMLFCHISKYPDWHQHRCTFQQKFLTKIAKSRDER
jgi:hypothetical protein